MAVRILHKPIVCAAACFVTSCTAAVENLTVLCPALPPLLVADMTLTFSGADSILSLTGGFGDVRLPATLTSEQTEIDGEAVRMIALKARGAATLAMPDRTALDACVAAKAPDATDRDAVAFAVNRCQHEVPAGAAVPVDVDVTVIVVGGPEADVSVSRAYAGDGGPNLETLPPLSCVVQ